MDDFSMVWGLIYWGLGEFLQSDLAYWLVGLFGVLNFLHLGGRFYHTHF